MKKLILTLATTFLTILTSLVYCEAMHVEFCAGYTYDIWSFKKFYIESGNSPQDAEQGFRMNCSRIRPSLEFDDSRQIRLANEQNPTGVVLILIRNDKQRNEVHRIKTYVKFNEPKGLGPMSQERKGWMTMVYEKVGRTALWNDTYFLGYVETEEKYEAYIKTLDVQVFYPWIWTTEDEPFDLSVTAYLEVDGKIQAKQTFTIHILTQQ